jgi:1-acyl-sn-glycerol-3-phosphate acyltransferase
VKWLLRSVVSLYFWLGLKLIFLACYLLSWLVAPLGGWGKGFYRQVVKQIIYSFLFLAGVRIDLHGWEKTPAKRSLLLVNRPCRNAPLYLVAALPAEVPMVIADTLLRIPVVGRVLKTLGYIPYPRREDDHQGTWLFAASLYQKLAAGIPVIVYYETFHGKSRHSREKLVKLLAIAARAEADVFPLVISTVGEGNRPNRDIFLLGGVNLTAGDPWDPGREGEVDRIRQFFAPLMTGPEDL